MLSKLSNFSGPLSSFTYGSQPKLMLSLDSYFYNPSIYSTTFTFDDANSYGVTHSSNTATSTVGGEGWAPYIISNESYSGKVKLKFQKGTVLGSLMCGFSDLTYNLPDNTYTNINFGFYLQSDSLVSIVENETSSGLPFYDIYQINGTFSSSTVYSIIYDELSVKYYIDDILVYTSDSSPLPTNPLYLFITFLNTSGLSLTNIEFGSNTVWNDLSGNNRNFNLINSPNYINKSFYFNTGNSQSAVGNDIGTLSKFTVDTWFNLKSLPVDTNPQIMTNIFDNGNINFSIGYIDGPDVNGNERTGKIMGGFFYYDSGLWVNTDGIVPNINTWYNAVLTYNQEHLNFYINGNTYSSFTSSLPVTTSGLGIRIGERWDLPEYIDGSIDIIKIWNDTLTQTQILDNYNSISPRYLTTDSSILLQGDPQWLEIPKSNDWNLNNTYTIEFWSNAATNSIGDIFTILCQQPGDNNIDIFYIDGRLRVRDSQDVCDEPTPGVWTHVAIVSDSGSLTVYYNGVGTYSSSGNTLYDTTNGLAIGRRGPDNNFQYFNGKLYGIRINNTAVYTSDFNPYAVALSMENIEGTTLLIDKYQPYIDTFIDSSRRHNITMRGASYSNDIPIFAYRYFRLIITGIKNIDEIGAEGCTQMSNLILRLNDVDVNWNNSAVASNPSGTYSLSETPQNLLDDYLYNKWCDQNYLINGETSTVYIDNSIPIEFDSYYYTTANDVPGRDPVTWSLSISDDNTNWIIISSISDANITNNRYSDSPIFAVN
jgi:hypothetical protein